MMQFDLPKDKSSIIKVIGVGGGGSNAVNHMFHQGIQGVDFVICNTDQQALDVSPVPNKIQLGATLTEGRGAGSIPDVGKNAAVESMDDIKRILEVNTKMVFITAGMGGGTGTGAAPVIAGIAKEMGILTVGIVTMPFSFEGRKREMQAKEGLEQLKKNVDTLLIIKNDKLREIHGNLTMKNAYAQADNILTTAAKSIAEIITKTFYINVDFADVFTVMNNSGVAIMGSAIAEGEDRAIKAAKMALESPLLNDNNIEGARYILLNIVSGTQEITMDEFDEITTYVQEAAGFSADLISGNGVDEELGDKVSVTIIATGFKTSQEIGVEKSNERIIRTLTEETPLAVTVPVIVASIPTSEDIVATIEEVTNETIEEVTAETEIESDGMVLISKTVEEQRAEEQRSFEFDISLPSVKKAEIVTMATLATVSNEADNNNSNNFETEADEQLRRSKERIMKLKELSMKMKSPSAVSDLEKEPAYKRRNINLASTPHSSESQVSRYTLSDEDGRPEIKPNNPFLHDKVD
jgi:cell division protein FtsZ